MHSCHLWCFINENILNVWKYCSNDSLLSSGLHLWLTCQYHNQIQPHWYSENLLQEIPKLIFSYGLCGVSCVYEQQCVHSLDANGGNFVTGKLYRWYLRRDVISGLWFSKNNTEVVDEPSENVEIEEDENYNDMEEEINHGQFLR